MSDESQQTQCDLCCDESSEVGNAAYDADIFWQDDTSPSSSSVVTEAMIYVSDGSAGSDNADGSDGSAGSDNADGPDGSGFPHEAEVPQDAYGKTENIAVAGKRY